MEIHYSSKDALSQDAERLIDFDVDSIRQLVAAERAPEPELWLADPEGYQDGTHTRRDSESIRLIAYSGDAQVVYATDGCNVCRHLLDARLERFLEKELRRLSAHTQLPRHLLERLAELSRPGPASR